MQPKFDIQIKTKTSNDHQIILTDVANGCILDIEDVYIPSNLNSPSSRERFMSRQLDNFLQQVFGDAI